MKSIYWTLLFSLGLAACSSSENAEVEKIEPQVKFLSAINPPTRATETNFETGDEIGVFAVERTGANTGGVLQTKNYADNVPYVYSGSFFMPENLGIKLPSNGSALFYRAVYPYLPSYSNEFTFYVKTDQYTNRGYTNSDLMTAETNATTEETPVLLFNHRLCNIVFNLNYEERPSGTELLRVKNVKTSAVVNLNKNSYTAGNETQTVLAASNGTNSFKVILPPQTVARGQELVTVEIGTEKYTLETENELTWNSGRQYEYTINIAKTGEVTFTGSINPWDTSDNIEEVVPPSILDDMEAYIPIHRGKNPPSIEGIYLIEPMEAVYCSDGYFEPGDDSIVPSLLAFANQNNTNFTIEFAEKDGYGNLSVGDGAFISGSGNNFSVYFDTEGYTVVEEETILNTTALVISGTRTSTGIQNLYYAFVMVDKDDPNGHLMEIGAFRVFKDGDNLAANSTWEYFEQTRTHKWNSAKSRNDLIRAVK